ncbi:exodeoxyribonuclease VII large subunit [soil metagenome]
MFTQESGSALTLSGLARMIAGVFQRTFSGERFWVIAEVISLKVSRGHCYLQLAEKDQNTVTPKAEFRGIIWGETFERLNAFFLESTGSVLKENIQILCSVEVQFHERYGLSLIVHDLDPAFTLGQLELERKRTIERLKKEGIYHLNKEKILPKVIQKIAVISALDSKGFEDFITRLTDNIYGYTFDVKLYPSLLQGDLAAGEIITRLIAIYEEQIIRQADVVVIVRGGGGASSLECFNDFQLARAVARFPLPVLTGIGHTSNRSVVDEVAFNDLLTPTDVAGYIVNRVAVFEGEINAVYEQINEIALNYLNEESDYFENAGQQLADYTRQVLTDENKFAEQLLLQIRYLCAQLLQQSSTSLDQTIQRLGINLKYHTDTQKKELIVASQAVSRVFGQQLQQQELSLQHLEERIQILDPQRVLKRGYSYTLRNGKVLKSIQDVAENDIVETVLADGNFISTIKSKVNGREI